MSAIEKIDPAELVNVASEYTYDQSVFFMFEECLIARMHNFGKDSGGYGREIDDHLIRTSSMADQLMSYCLYDHRLRQNIRNANRFHDVGKTALTSTIFNIMGEVSDDIKAERTSHIYMIEEILEDIVNSFPHLKGHPHIAVTACIGLNHHERIDGSGPRGLTKIGTVMEIIGITDTYDGKLMIRPGKTPKSPGAILAEMHGEPNAQGVIKHPAGEFDPDLLDRFTAMLKQSDQLNFDNTGKLVLAT